MPKEKTLQLLTRSGQALLGGIASPNQVAHCFMYAIRNPDGCQFSGPVQTSQQHCVAPVGLYPITRPHWNERGSNDVTSVPESKEMAV
jgi:hypothetical protein